MDDEDKGNGQLGLRQSQDELNHFLGLNDLSSLFVLLNHKSEKVSEPTHTPTHSEVLFDDLSIS